MPTNQQELQDFATHLKPLLGELARALNSFSKYDRVPTYLKHASEAPGIFICTECCPPVNYRDKTVAQNHDPHWNQPVWLKRYHMWNDRFEDPWVRKYLNAEQREKGLRPANHHS